MKKNDIFLAKIKSRLMMFSLTAAFVLAAPGVGAETFELIKYGNFDNWLSRVITESKLLGGETKTIYEICPSGTDKSGKPYTNRGGSPWATSNVLASPAGITKASNAVTPVNRQGYGKCAKLECKYDHCKAIGFVNIEVIVGGSIFLGKMIEPVKSTSNPYSHFDMGVPFTRRPQALQFDYCFYLPDTNERVYSSGFGKKKTLPGADKAETLVMLQQRWEDSDGNIFAKRVGTARETYAKSTKGWHNGHRLKVTYGEEGAKIKPLMPAAKTYYAYNSKGKIVPVKEVGWAEPGTSPTHAIVMFSAAAGDPYTGTPGLTLWIDNVGWVF